MRVNRTVINVVIVLAIAAVVAIAPAGGTAASFVIETVSLGFLAAGAWIASRLYREHRVALYSLGDRRRAIVYIAVGVGTLTVCAYQRLTRTGGGTVVFLLLLAGCVIAVYRVYRSARTY
jgi:hypothetical protein